jgi:hypothetical protein
LEGHALKARANQATRKPIAATRRFTSGPPLTPITKFRWMKDHYARRKELKFEVEAASHLKGWAGLVGDLAHPEGARAQPVMQGWI